MIDEKTYRKIQKKIKVLETARDEAIGAVRQLEKDLKKEFGCKDLKSAKKLLKKMKKKQEEDEKIFKRDFKTWMGRFGLLVEAIEKEDPKVHRIAKAVLKTAKAGKGSGKKSKKGSS
jgi:hypothetical protein